MPAARLHRRMIAGAIAIATAAASLATGVAVGTTPHAGVAAAPQAGVAARDDFAGLIRSGAGSLAGAGGHARLALVPGAGTGNIRRVAATLTGRVCRRGGCRKIAGPLRGTLARLAHQVPDVGQRFQLRLAGRVKPFGQVAANGMVNGTGFIARGHETLSLTVTTAHGTVSIVAQSPLVPGFTSP